MPSETDAASSCSDDHEHVSAKGAWPKGRSTHEVPLPSPNASFSERAEGFPGSLPTKPPCSSCLLTFPELFTSAPFPRKINFYFPAQLNRRSSILEVKNVQCINWSTWSVFLLALQFHSESVVLSHKPHNQQSVLWFFPALTFPDFLTQSISARGRN